MNRTLSFVKAVCSDYLKKHSILLCFVCFYLTSDLYICLILIFASNF